MGVIPNLNQKQGITPRGGWILKEWSRELTTKNKKQEEITAIHHIWYLQLEIAGHIITSQHKGWNSTIRMAMFADVAMNSNYAEKTKVGRRLLWMDNCASNRIKQML
jgi:hypothetical protein